MKKGYILKYLILDLGKALAVGLAAGAVLAAVLFAGGFLAGGFRAVNGLEAMKDGLLLVSSLGLFLVAGMLLTKGKKKGSDEEKEKKNGWRRHFRVIVLKTVVIMICIALIALASAADYIMMM